MAVAGKYGFHQGTTPETPASGVVWFYSKPDDKLYYLTDDGTEHWITSSGVVPPDFTLLDLTDTPSIYENGKILQSTTTGTEWVAGGGGGTTFHNLLDNLDYASAGHTGFASTAALTAVSGSLQDEIDNIDPDTTLEEARLNGNTFSGTVDYDNNSITNVSGIGFYGGQEITWNADDNTINIPTGLGSTLQVGQEEFFKVHNNTGDTLANGTIVHNTTPVTFTNGYPNVEGCISNTFEGIFGTVGVVTAEIADGEEGMVTTRGYVRDMDTSTLDVGQVWVSPTVSGAMTDDSPEFPNYDFSIGAVLVKDAINGMLIVSMASRIYDTYDNFWNGTMRESMDLLVTSSGSTVTGTLTCAADCNDLTMMFSDGFTMLDCPTTVVLTAGTDENPQTNYVYIPKSTKVLTASTASWAATEHIKVAQIALFSAASTAADGALRNQNVNDHIEGTDGQGHMSHITQAIREKIGATWKSGCEGASSVDTGSTPDDVWVTVTGGVVQQLHDQTFPSFDTETGDDIHVINNDTTAYETVSNLNTQLSDATGSTLNNTSFSFVLWGICNKTGTPSHLMLNLPSGSYAFITPDSAVTDALNHSVYTIPQQYHGVGFLIARFTYTYKNDDWVLYDTEDLRGKMPNTTAGGGAGGTGVTSFLGLTDTPSDYTDDGDKFVKVGSGETALEFVSADYATSAELATTSGTLDTKIDTTSGTLQTQITANEDQLYLDSSPTDGNYSGTTATITMATAGSFGQLKYMTSGGKLGRCNATDGDAMPGVCMTLESAGVDEDSLVLLQGFITDESWNWLPGSIVYAETSNNEMTQTAPDETGNLVQAVGFATHADTIYFNPNFAMGEVA